MPAATRGILARLVMTILLSVTFHFKIWLLVSFPSFVLFRFKSCKQNISQRQQRRDSKDNLNSYTLHRLELVLKWWTSTDSSTNLTLSVLMTYSTGVIGSSLAILFKFFTCLLRKINSVVEPIRVDKWGKQRRANKWMHEMNESKCWWGEWWKPTCVPSTCFTYVFFYWNFWQRRYIIHNSNRHLNVILFRFIHKKALHRNHPDKYSASWRILL